MVEQAMHMLLQPRSDGRAAYSRVDIDTTLVVRESTAAPTATAADR
jgi:DNA-binding LacI/PurR family transcriptional regulator